MFENEPRCLDSFGGLILSTHVNNAIAALNPQSNSTMLGIRFIEAIRHDPFIYTKAAAWLKDAEDLFIYFLKAWGVDRGFDDIDCIESIIWEIKMLS